MESSEKITKIENGIVIDHIPTNALWKVIEILELSKRENGRISIGTNYSSKKTNEKKGIIKIEGKTLTTYEMDLIALITPDVTINIIENFEIKEKRYAKIPTELIGILSCTNKNCISNQTKEKIKSKINFKDNTFNCYYCDQRTTKEEAKIQILSYRN